MGEVWPDCLVLHSAEFLTIKRMGRGRHRPTASFCAVSWGLSYLQYLQQQLLRRRRFPSSLQNFSPSNEWLEADIDRLRTELERAFLCLWLSQICRPLLQSLPGIRVICGCNVDSGSLPPR